ncbi:hypothetical protein HK098_008165 [Nowakowskiella sp. JEL0407]|nr:hypothetical protein HK098_008165 [Nowakowskiella sp. JEL0407]
MDQLFPTESITELSENPTESSTSSSDLHPLGMDIVDSSQSSEIDFSLLETAPEDLKSVVELFHTFSHKLFISDFLYRKNHLASDGFPHKKTGNPANDAALEWTKWWVELWGPVLLMWQVPDDIASQAYDPAPSVAKITSLELHPSESIIDEIKSSQPNPSFINITESIAHLLQPQFQPPGTSTSFPPPPIPYTSFFALNTAGSNIYLLASHSLIQANSFVAAIRLASFEMSLLNHYYSLKLLKRPSFEPIWKEILARPSDVVWEGQVQARFTYGREWSPFWVLVTKHQIPNIVNDLEEEAKKKKWFGGKLKKNELEPPKQKVSQILFYKDRNDVKRSVPVIQLTMVTHVAAIWPEKVELVNAPIPALLKIEGKITIAPGSPPNTRKSIFETDVPFDDTSSITDLVDGSSRPPPQHVLLMAPNSTEMGKILSSVLQTFNLETEIEKVPMYENIGTLRNQGIHSLDQLDFESADTPPSPTEPTAPSPPTEPKWGLLFLSNSEVSSLAMDSSPPRPQFTKILADKMQMKRDGKLDVWKKQVSIGMKNRVLFIEREVQKKAQELVMWLNQVQPGRMIDYEMLQQQMIQQQQQLIIQQQQLALQQQQQQAQLTAKPSQKKKVVIHNRAKVVSKPRPSSIAIENPAAAKVEKKTLISALKNNNRHSVAEFSQKEKAFVAKNRSSFTEIPLLQDSSEDGEKIEVSEAVGEADGDASREVLNDDEDDDEKTERKVLRSSEDIEQQIKSEEGNEIEKGDDEESEEEESEDEILGLVTPKLNQLIIPQYPVMPILPGLMPGMMVPGMMPAISPEPPKLKNKKKEIEEDSNEGSQSEKSEGEEGDENDDDDEEEEEEGPEQMYPYTFGMQGMMGVQPIPALPMMPMLTPEMMMAMGQGMPYHSQDNEEEDEEDEMPLQGNGETLDSLIPSDSLLAQAAVKRAERRNPYTGNIGATKEHGTGPLLGNLNVSKPNTTHDPKEEFNMAELAMQMKYISGPLLGRVDREAQKPKLEAGLLGEVDRRKKEKEMFKKMIRLQAGVASGNVNPQIMGGPGGSPQIPPMGLPPMDYHMGMMGGMNPYMPMMPMGMPPMPPMMPGMPMPPMGMPGMQQMMYPPAPVSEFGPEYMDDYNSMMHRDLLRNEWLERERLKERQKYAERGGEWQTYSAGPYYPYGNDLNRRSSYIDRPRKLRDDSETESSDSAPKKSRKSKNKSKKKQVSESSDSNAHLSRKHGKMNSKSKKTDSEEEDSEEKKSKNAFSVTETESDSSSSSSSGLDSLNLVPTKSAKKEKPKSSESEETESESDSDDSEPIKKQSKSDASKNSKKNKKKKLQKSTSSESESESESESDSDTPLAFTKPPVSRPTGRYDYYQPQQTYSPLGGPMNGFNYPPSPYQMYAQPPGPYPPPDPYRMGLGGYQMGRYESPISSQESRNYQKSRKTKKAEKSKKKDKKKANAVKKKSKSKKKDSESSEKSSEEEIDTEESSSEEVVVRKKKEVSSSSNSSDDSQSEKEVKIMRKNRRN